MRFALRIQFLSIIKLQHIDFTEFLMTQPLAGVGFAVDDQCSVRIFFGLFAIRRSDTTNNAMFDPDFCGVWILSVAMRFFRLFFLHDYDFSSPQNRFKGPKAVRFQSLLNSCKQKRKTHHKGVFSFLVAGVGFEPHDLRVMSPTSYQTAPSRDIMVPEAGVEPVREKISRDFKSRASANSAIPAFCDRIGLPHCSYIISFSYVNVKCFLYIFEKCF